MDGTHDGEFPRSICAFLFSPCLTSPALMPPVLPEMHHLSPQSWPVPPFCVIGEKMQRKKKPQWLKKELQMERCGWDLRKERKSTIMKKGGSELFVQPIAYRALQVGAVLLTPSELRSHFPISPSLLSTYFPSPSIFPRTLRRKTSCS